MSNQKKIIINHNDPIFKVHLEDEVKEYNDLVDQGKAPVLRGGSCDTFGKMREQNNKILQDHRDGKPNYDRLNIY